GLGRGGPGTNPPLQRLSCRGRSARGQRGTDGTRVTLDRPALLRQESRDSDSDHYQDDARDPTNRPSHESDPAGPTWLVPAQERAPAIEPPHCDVPRITVRPAPSKPVRANEVLAIGGHPGREAGKRDARTRPAGSIVEP